MATRDELVKIHRIVVFEGLEGAGHVQWMQYKDLMLSQSANFFYYMLDLAQSAQ